jgi:hypothetical protein
MGNTYANKKGPDVDPEIVPRQFQALFLKPPSNPGFTACCPCDLAAVPHRACAETVSYIWVF